MDDRDLYKPDFGCPHAVSCTNFERQNHVRIRCPFRKAYLLPTYSPNNLKRRAPELYVRCNLLLTLINVKMSAQ